MVKLVILVPCDDSHRPRLRSDELDESVDMWELAGRGHARGNGFARLPVKIVAFLVKQDLEQLAGNLHVDVLRVLGAEMLKTPLVKWLEGGVWLRFDAWADGV